MNPKKIDGSKLVAELEDRLIRLVENTEEKTLPLAVQLTMEARSKIRQTLREFDKKEIHGEIFEEVVEQTEVTWKRTLVAVLERDAENLPEEMKQVLEILLQVKEAVTGIKPEKKTVAKPALTEIRPPALAEKRSVADVRFEILSPQLTIILDQLGKEMVGSRVNKTHLKEAPWQSKIKFSPFVELAKISNLSPEVWMDCDAARRACAKWLREKLNLSPASANAFYAHVTAKFRDVDGSLWTKYKKENVVEAPVVRAAQL